MFTFRHVVAGIAVVAALAAGSANAGIQDDVFSVHDLVADGAGTAPVADASLVNAWGLTAGPTTPWWSSNNGTNTSTLYNASGAKQALTVSVPGGPTGTVFNGSATDFVVSQSGKSGSARFLFATEAGQVLGWSPTVNGTTAITGADSSTGGAVYKGLAIAAGRLYATDFHNGRVDVFDKSFAQVSLPFQDPKLPKGYAPFGIQALAGSIFVTYARQDAAKKDDVAGAGAGYVDQFTTEGQLVARVASGSGDLLIGNFGNGRISAYQDRGGGKWVYKGQLRRGDQTLIAIDGLWAIAFGNDAAAGPATSLYFAAGPGGGAHGRFGSITAG